MYFRTLGFCNVTMLGISHRRVQGILTVETQISLEIRCCEFCTGPGMLIVETQISLQGIGVVSFIVVDSRDIYQKNGHAANRVFGGYIMWKCISFHAISEDHTVARDL